MRTPASRWPAAAHSTAEDAANLVVTFVRAEGVALGTEARAKAIEAARGEVTKLAA